MDACGLSTALHCTYGRKLLIFRRENTDSSHTFGHLLGDEFDLEAGYDDSEAILLDNSSTMYAFSCLLCIFLTHLSRIIPPGVIHAVHTLEPAVAEGSHFFSSATLTMSLVSLIHTFVCNDLITNISHPETRVLLRRIQHLFHRGLICDVPLKPAEQDHLPNIMVREGDTVPTEEAIDFLAICVLSYLADALDPRTYMAPGQSPSSHPNSLQQKLLDDLHVNQIKASERKEIWLARGCARECLEWFSHEFVVRPDRDGWPTDYSAFLLCFISLKILRYMYVAELKGVTADGFASYDAVQREIEASLALDPDIWDAWTTTLADGALSRGLECSSSGSLDNPNWSSEPLFPCIDKTSVVRRKHQGKPMKLKSLEELQVHGMRKLDREYQQALEDFRTVEIHSA